MAKVKLRNEKSGIVSLLFISLVVLISSAVFLILSAKRAELGGIFLMAMLVFISGYAFLVSIKKLIQYSRCSKIQKAVLNDGIIYIKELEDVLNISNKTLMADIKFMQDNGYLGNMQIVEGRLVDIKLEQEKYQKARQAAIVKFNEQQQSPKSQKQKKQKIVSEKCPNCGASVNFEGDETDCPYCGNSLNKV